MSSEPIYAAPITIPSGATLVVTMRAGSTSSGYTVNLTAGTYYNHHTGGSSFLGQVASDWESQDQTTNGAWGGSWTAAAPSTGLDFRSQLIRTGGQSGDGIESVVCNSQVVADALGWSSLTVDKDDTDSVITNDSPSTDSVTINSNFQRGYLWAPRDLLLRDVRSPINRVTAAKTPAGKGGVDRWGGHQRWTHTLDWITGALAYLDKAAHDDFYSQLAYGQGGNSLYKGDPYAPFEHFWNLCSSLVSNGTPPTLKYVPDSSAPTTDVEDFMIIDEEWLSDFDEAVEIVNDAPMYCKVTIRGQEAV